MMSHVPDNYTGFEKNIREIDVGFKAMKSFIYLFLYVCKCACVRARVCVWITITENNFPELVLSFHCGFWGSNSGCKTCSKCFPAELPSLGSPLSYLAQH